MPGSRLTVALPAERIGQRFKTAAGHNIRTSASRMHQELDRPSLKNSWAYQSRVPLTALLLVGAWIYVALTPPLIKPSETLGWTTDVLGWVVYLGGSFLRIWATLWIAGRKKQTLVDDGPYRMCRNPLYVGTFAMGLGLALILKSLVFGVAYLLAFSLYAFFVVPAEEHYMGSRFPAAFDEYRARVPRWFPHLGLLRRDEFLRRVEDRGALYRECLRMICWMLLPVLAEITVHYRPLTEFLSGGSSGRL
jgi:protein-S-isoprenylcysteine O-methyltransferase Ste14